MPINPYSYRQYTADGTTTQFAVPFPFIDRFHIAVTVNNTPTPFTWIHDGLISISPAPVNGLVVEVRRNTPTDIRLAVFQNASVQAQTELNLSALQSFYTIQEDYDLRSQLLLKNNLGLYDVLGARIINLGTPIAVTDAATKAYVDASFSVSPGSHSLGSHNDSVGVTSGAGNLLVGDAAQSQKYTTLLVGNHNDTLVVDLAQTKRVKWASWASALLTVLTTKGDLLVSTGATTQRKAVGVDGKFLKSDSTKVDGLDWADPPTPVDPVLDFSGTLKNVGITATVGSNTLTVTLTAKNGTALSPSNKAEVSFRNASPTLGQHNIVSVTAPVSLVVSNGSTLGTTLGDSANSIVRLYILALNNLGNVELAIWNPYLPNFGGLQEQGGGLYGVNESTLITTTAEGGIGGADSAHTAYSMVARSNLPVRVLGYIETQPFVGGLSWIFNPTTIQVMGPGVLRTGDVAQRWHKQTFSQGSTATPLPVDDTIPQNTEGGEYFSQSLTFTSTMNRAVHEGSFNYFTTSGSVFSAWALFRNFDSSAFAAGLLNTTGNGNAFQSGGLGHEHMCNTTAPVTFRVRLGATGGTFRLNGSQGVDPVFGFTASSWYRITEIFT